MGGDSDLASRRCIPCDSRDIRALSEEAAKELLHKIDGWTIVADDGHLKLYKSWKAKSFTKAVEFFQHVADVSEAEGHHPDLHLTALSNISMDIWTHRIGGLTESDFILAAKIDSLDLEHLLKKRKIPNKRAPSVYITDS